MSEPILRPTIFWSGIVAGFTTRAFAAADEPLDAVRARVGARVGMPVASVGQVHRADVAVIRGATHVAAHDGLVTDTAGLLLTVISADCALLLFADEEAGVVGACHSGWRGTVAGVAGQTVKAMAGLGARPERIRAYLAPCISVEAFEVGEEVAARFGDAVVRRDLGPKPHVDLRTDLRRQLREAGLQETHLEVSAGCTVREIDRFYSYRAEGGAAGRMIGYIGRET